MSETCPSCGNQAAQLIPVDAGTRLALQNTDEGAPTADKVCADCQEKLAKKVSVGFQLRNEAKMREKNKMMLWKTRTNLIKQARALMENKSFSEAAVNYEKYIRVLEIVYNLKPGELTPDTFNKSNRSKELTVLATVYWDLMRIYDTSPRYGERMQNSANKLAIFIPYSTIYPDIMKKAESFVKGAKNPGVVKSFLKKAKGKRGGCFIATATYDDAFAPEVEAFRKYRDQILLNSFFGRVFVAAYYRGSPSLARIIRSNPRLKRLSKRVLDRIAHKLMH